MSNYISGLKEKDFEAYIEQWLTSEKGGYTKGNQKTYDKERAIDMVTLITFIKKTQPKLWERFERVHGNYAEERLYQIFQFDVANYGLIYVLRNGINDHSLPTAMKLCYFAPASRLNTDLQERYEANILHCTRQFAYSTQNHNTIDMVLSLNGIPVIALELKNQFTGQSVENSREQWKNDREPKELLFHFDTRILAYFGVDLYEAIIATELKKDKTFFMPYNQGSNGAGNVGGAGNPMREDGEFVTSYLWENVLQRDQLLAILQRYIMRQTETKLEIIIDKHGKEKEKKTESTKIIFPRYHQLDVVEHLVTDTYTEGPGHNYLIQHSAGSGKSNSIAWLTYRLSTLHDKDDNAVFTGVFVITDRRVLNRQLQETILSFDHKDGQVVTVTDKDNSSVLKDAINEDKRIIITTLHRFPIIYDQLESRAGKRYAIIVDEAHSSQSGKAAEKTKAALADTEEALRELAELEEKTIEELEAEKDALMEDLLAQGQHKNLSFYAFTATPKPKTLQTFGRVTERGATPQDTKYGAYHNYSMLQAIEEGFIKDVLKNYTTFDITYEIAKNVQENPEYEETPATRAVKIFHDNHQDTINKKTAIMVEKFREVTLLEMGGMAKAMVVTASRAHAVRYFLAIKDYCKKNNITDIHPMVAFSGKVSYNGTEYTEPQLNSTPDRKISEDRLPLYFASDIYNMLIVADKYQTGFDEPRLQTMFVDKKLKNVKAVQTLSRLNRWQKDKKDTFVFDFVNGADEIKAAFEPFYTATELVKPVDVNYVYTFRKDIEQYHLWGEQTVEEFYAIYEKVKKEKSGSRLAKLSNIFKPILDAFGELEEEKRFEVRSKVKNFIRFYSYMAQIARTFDKTMHKTYIFADYLYKVLPKNAHEHVDLNAKLLLVNNAIKEVGTTEIKLEKKPGTVKGENGTGKGIQDDKRDLLDNIIDKVNIMFQGNFSPADRVMVEGILTEIQRAANKKMKQQVGGNDEQQFVEAIFPQIFQNAAQSCYTSQTDAYRKLFQNQEFYQTIMQQMGHAVYEQYRNQEREAFTPENLRAKMIADVSTYFVASRFAGQLNGVFDTMMAVINADGPERYSGLADTVLHTMYKLFCSPQKMEVSDRRTHLKQLVTGYEAFIKKLHYLVTGREVTTREGDVEHAALSNAIYSLRKLNELKYAEEGEQKQFGEFLEIMTNLRNSESHRSMQFGAQEVDAGYRMVAAMYLYTVALYNNELAQN